MLKAIFNWFTGKPLPGTEAPAVKADAVPYKVETPAPTAPVVEPMAVGSEGVAPTPAAKPKAPARKKPVVEAQGQAPAELIAEPAAALAPTSKKATAPRKPTAK
jgi:hypothetical protein